MSASSGGSQVLRKPNGQLHVTLQDVANLAGVSAKTVSRVVNNQGEIKEATRKRVQSAIDKLGYRPNFLARSLVRFFKAPVPSGCTFTEVESKLKASILSRRICSCLSESPWGTGNARSLRARAPSSSLEEKGRR